MKKSQIILLFCLSLLAVLGGSIFSLRADPGDTGNNPCAFVDWGLLPWECVEGGEGTPTPGAWGAYETIICIGEDPGPPGESPKTTFSDGEAKKTQPDCDEELLGNFAYTPQELKFDGGAWPSSKFDTAGEKTISVTKDGKPDPDYPCPDLTADLPDLEYTVVEVIFIAPSCVEAEEGEDTKTFRKEDFISTNPPGHEDLFTVTPLTLNKGVNTITASCGSYSETKDISLASKKWVDNSVTNGFSLTINPSIMNKVNNALSKIPGGKIQLKEVKGTVSGKKRDCCASSTLKTDGERYLEGQVTLKIKGKDLRIWPGPLFPDLEQTFGPSFGVEVEVVVRVGVYLSLDVATVVTAGKRWEDCKPESCAYGSITLDVDLGLSAKAEAISCIETYFTDKHCADVTLVNATITGGFSVGGRINKREACDGPHLVGSLKDTSWSVRVGALGFSHTFGPWVIIPGGSL